MTSSANQTCLPSSSAPQVKRKLEMDAATEQGSRVRRRLSSTCSSATEELRESAAVHLSPSHSLPLLSLSRLANVDGAAYRDVAGYANEEVLRSTPRVARRRSGPERSGGDAARTEETDIRHYQRAGRRGAHHKGLQKPHTMEVSLTRVVRGRMERFSCRCVACVGKREREI